MSIASTHSSASASSSSSDSEPDVPKNSLKRKNVASDSESESEDNSSSEDDEGVTGTSNTRKRKPLQSKAEDAEQEEEQEEVEVLSHAEKRRQKKRQKVTETSSSDVNAKTTSSKDKAKSTKKKNGADNGGDTTKRQNSVWVGNLSFKTTPENLRTFFEGVGEITRVHMPMKAPVAGADKQKGKWPAAAAKENRGFAYVDFATSDAKVIAITFSEKNLDGRRLLIKDGGDFAGRPAPAQSGQTSTDPNSRVNTPGLTKTAQKILSAQKQPPGPALFIGNLGFETTPENITELFTAHHRSPAANKKDKTSDEVNEAESAVDEEKDKKNGVGIRKVRMGTFEDSGLCKGFSFVDFISVEHATAVLTNPRNHKLNGRQLVVEYASPDAVRRGGHREKGSGPPRGFKKSEGKPERRERAGEGEGDSKRPSRDIDGKLTGKDDDDEETPFFKRGRDARDAQKKRRPKPGAALALAKRENVAIVPSEGTRIVF